MSYRAFWQRRCRAAAAEAVLEPLGGNCAVLPKDTNQGVQKKEKRKQHILALQRE